MQLPSILKKLWEDKFSLKRKVQLKEPAQLLKKMSVLLGEGYTFSDSLFMLLPHHLKNMSELENDILEQLRNGASMTEVLNVLGYPKIYLMTILVAEQHGKTIQALKTVAFQLEKKEQNRQRLIKLLTYPIVLFIILIVLFFAFRTYFLPNMSFMMNNRTSNGKLDLTMSAFFLHLPDLFIVLATLLFVILMIIWRWICKKTIEDQIQFLMKIPIVNRQFKLQITRQIAYELGGLIESGMPMQEGLDILQKQSLQPYLAKIAEIIQQRIVYGDSLSTAIERENFFYKGFCSHVMHGEQGGNLGRELQIYSEFLTDRTENNVQRVLTLVQPLLFVIIALCILGAYLAILLPMYEMLELV
ncbi:competence type IV pilus assembly protein ComGB [Rummeliibacillus pycnus]|uniref:competence type IV pilus assembly protein ComGB n=1 Tax=Rummeliibacillus pycnus TaxID=101070 RepID=UPI003D2B9B56